MGNPRDSVAMLITGRITGLIIFLALVFLLYEYGDVWAGWIVACMIVALLIAGVMVFDARYLKSLFGFLKPLAKGAGKALGQIGKDEVEKKLKSEDKNTPQGGG